MKAYSKPRLVALSLNANDLLCGCKIDVAPGTDGDVDPEINKMLGNLYPGETNFFTDKYSCGTNVSMPDIEAYCKFGPFPSDTMIFSS